MDCVVQETVEFADENDLGVCNLEVFDRVGSNPVVGE